ncbi:transporter [soil metagenome]
MKFKFHHFLILAALVPVLSYAEEGGGGHYAPGAMASMFDNVSETPGFGVALFYNYYEGSASASQALPIAGSLDLGVSAVSNSAVLGLTYTFEPRVLGARVMTGVFVPIQSLEVEAQASVSSLGSASVRDTTNGIADITIIPFDFSWKMGDWTWCALLNVYAPTGGFNTSDLANLGKNYWTFDPTFGVTYFSEKSGFSATLFSGLTMNTENSDTDYQSGAGLHFDATVAQYLPLGKGLLGIGATGFWFEQVTGDSGSGATLGDFEGRTAGVGPVLSYILPMGKRSLAAELKWLPELDTKNRLEGDYIWFKFGMTF